MENPVQLRLGFNAPTAPQRWIVTLAGTRVVVSPQDGDNLLTLSYLASIGASAGQGEDGVVSVPVGDLRRFPALPDHVMVVPRAPLDTLVTLLQRPPVADDPVVVTLEKDGGFNLSWFDGRVGLNEPLPLEAAPAFISLEIAFVADNETWDELLAASQLPVLLGRARVNLDGFVEVVTSKPQKVEASPLRALFKLDDTHYGVPLAYASDLADVPGYVWEGRRPSYDQAPSVLPDLGLELSEHARADLHVLTSRLAVSRAELVAWRSGLGRRIFALAAVASLEAFPLLIVTTPQGIWVWQRHLDLLGRTWSLTHDRADARIVTYRDLFNRREVASPSAMILDDLDRVPAEHRQAVKRLDGVLDAYRIGICSALPEGPAEAISLMASLRPAEFRTDVSLLSRYPLRPDTRAREHVAAYVSRRVEGDQDHGFRRSTVELLDPSDDQIATIERALAAEHRPMDEALAEGLAVLSGGTATTTGPKIARAVELARTAQRDGRSAVLVTRYPRTAQLLRLALRPLTVEVVERADQTVSRTAEAVSVVVSQDGRLPDLRSVDTVVVLDYFWSSLVLDAAVGSAADPEGPRVVLQLHLRIPLDDRCALLAARRRELGPVGDPLAPLSSEDLAFLLSDRR